MKAPSSRQKARKKFKEIYEWPDMPKQIVVHHDDGNPFNNEIDNLKPMRLPRHTSHHLKGKPKRTNVEILREIDSLLVIINER